MAKFKALDIANLFIDLANSLPNNSIDNMKVNKLCYYAQGWSLAKLGYPLFDDDVQAWKYGPVIPSVYYAYRAYDGDPISTPSYHFDESLLSSDEVSLLTDVYMTYGKYTSGQLRDKTHEAGSPWSQVYVEMMNNPISSDSMKAFFSKSNELETMTLNLSPEKIISYGPRIFQLTNRSI